MSLGGALQQARCTHVESLPNNANVLVVGEGDGRFLEALVQARPDCNIDVVDKSAAMLELAKHRAGESSHVRFFNLDARHFESRRRYDAIVTLFFLDCFQGHALQEVVANLGGQAQANARWLYADFATDRVGLSGVLHRSVVQLLYFAFARVTDIEARQLDDPMPLLAQLGFVPLDEQRLLGGLLRSVLLSRNDLAQVQ
jgi:SAM-dependent methyltransferase